MCCPTNRLSITQIHKLKRLSMPPILSARQLHLNFDDDRTLALNGVDIDIMAGEFVAITGPSGCGKSSLLNLLGMLEQPSAGELQFRGTPYAAITDAALFRRENIGFIFQSFHLIPTLTALDNVLIPTLGKAGNPALLRQRATMLLEQMGLADRLQHFPATLSGGERQRVAIARALINEPPILLADEPTGSLDSKNAAQVLDLLGQLRQQRALTLIIVTHDAAVSGRADRIIRMQDGKILPASGVLS